MNGEHLLPGASTLASITTAAAASSLPALPPVIGRYRIVRLVGAGGMGAVYEAEQDHPRRLVALKVIKAGLAGIELLRRFELESQVLGRLQHPGIAQIYEAGTADQGFGPQPYFAMEFIRGLTLRDYAQARRLSTRDRLELIVKICDAVHHAHQRGIIHRDLKPGNILVDESGQPKILDFGVARVTDSDAQATRQTDVGQLVGTLAYMSPEQVLADPLELDTRSDVYALGVILYELLSGRLPYSISPRLHEVVQTIREADPTRLSSIDKTYRGDIETIVAKAMEKDKSRRYSSASGLAADIRRYLNDEPITARPPSTSYQLRKFAQRHKALVGGLAAVFVVLLLGIVASRFQALRAIRAEQSALVQRDQANQARQVAAEERDRAVRAEQQANEARNQALTQQQRADKESATAKAVNEFLRTDLLAQASAYNQASPTFKPDPDLKVRTALDRAAARVEGKFDKQPLVEASIRQTIGSSYMDLGLLPEAQQHIQRALVLRRQGLGDEHQDTMATMGLLTKVFRLQGKYQEDEPLLRKLLDVQKRVLGETHRDTLDTMNELALLYRLEGKLPQAESLYISALKIYRRIAGPDDTDAAGVMHNLASLYRQQGQYDEAMSLFVRYLDLMRRVLGPEHPDTVAGLASIASLELTMGRYEQAEAHNLEALEIRRRVLGPEHQDTLMTMANLAESLRSQRKYVEADPIYKQVADIRTRVLGPEHPDTLINLNNMALMYLDQKRYVEAEAIYSKVFDIRRRVLGPDHPSTLITEYSIAVLYRNQSKFEQAEPLLNHVIEARRRVLGPENPDTLIATLGLVTVYFQDAKYAQSEAFAREALATYRKARPDDWRRYESESRLGASLAGQKRYAEAESNLLSGYEGLERGKTALPPAGRAALEAAGDWIVGLYRDWGKPDQAAQWTAKLAATRSASTQK